MISRFISHQNWAEPNGVVILIRLDTLETGWRLILESVERSPILYSYIVFLLGHRLVKSKAMRIWFRSVGKANERYHFVTS